MAGQTIGQCSHSVSYDFTPFKSLWSLPEKCFHRVHLGWITVAETLS